MKLLHQILPLVVLGFAFSFKSVHSVHVIGLMVSSVQEESIGTQPLVRIEEQGNFSGPGSSIHEVTIEQVPVFVVG